MNDYPYKGPAPHQVAALNRDLKLIAARYAKCQSEHPGKPWVLGCYCMWPVEERREDARRRNCPQGV